MAGRVATRIAENLKANMAPTACTCIQCVQVLPHKASWNQETCCSKSVVRGLNRLSPMFNVIVEYERRAKESLNAIFNGSAALEEAPART